jgi:hypothetical protein
MASRTALASTAFADSMGSRFAPRPPPLGSIRPALPVPAPAHGPSISRIITRDVIIVWRLYGQFDGIRPPRGDWGRKGTHLRWVLCFGTDLVLRRGRATVTGPRAFVAAGDRFLYRRIGGLRRGFLYRRIGGLRCGAVLVSQHHLHGVLVAQRDRFVPVDLNCVFGICATRQKIFGAHI